MKKTVTFGPLLPPIESADSGAAFVKHDDGDETDNDSPKTQTVANSQHDNGGNND